MLKLNLKCAPVSNNPMRASLAYVPSRGGVQWVFLMKTTRYVAGESRDKVHPPVGPDGALKSAIADVCVGR